MRPQKHNENASSKPVPPLLLLTHSTTDLPRHSSDTKTKRHETIHTYRLLSPSPVNESVEYRTRHTTDLLWLPYILLTLILTSLLVASFIHFHCKNGHKYQRRRSPSTLQTGRDWRQKIVENALMTNQPTSADLYGALRSWTSDPDLQDEAKLPTKGLTKSGVTNYTTPIRTVVRETADQYSNELGFNFHRVRPSRTYLPEVSSSSMKVGEKDSGKLQSHVTSSKNNHRSISTSAVLDPILTNSPTVMNKITCASGGVGGVVYSVNNCNGGDDGEGGDRKRCYRSGGADGGRGVRTAQEYVSNRNGSMVNMRCGRPENVITFQDINKNIKRSESSLNQLRTPVGVGAANSSKRLTADATKLSTIANISSNQTVSFSRSRDGGENLGGRPYVNVGDACRTRAAVLGEGRDGGGAKALYSATKICRMDGTDDDWRVLQAHSQL